MVVEKCFIVPSLNPGLWCLRDQNVWKASECFVYTLLCLVLLYLIWSWRSARLFLLFILVLAARTTKLCERPVHVLFILHTLMCLALLIVDSLLVICCLGTTQGKQDRSNYLVSCVCYCVYISVCPLFLSPYGRMLDYSSLSHWILLHVCCTKVLECSTSQHVCCLDFCMCFVFPFLVTLLKNVSLFFPLGLVFAISVLQQGIRMHLESPDK